MSDQENGTTVPERQLEIVNDEAPPENATPTMVCETAFIVFRSPEGRWIADTDLNKPLTILREATFDDFYLGAASVMRDVAAMETASRTLDMQQQMAKQAMAQIQAMEQNKQIAAGLGDLKDPAVAKQALQRFTRT